MDRAARRRGLFGGWGMKRRAAGWAFAGVVLLLLSQGHLGAGQNLHPGRSAHAASPSLCTDIVVNGGFENGSADLSPWVSGGYACATEALAYDGDFGLWMGGYKNADDTVYQLVDLPLAASEVTLTYWWSMLTEEPAEGRHDTLKVSVRSFAGEILVQLEQLDNTVESDTWIQSSFDLGAYRGQAVQIHFQCSGDEQHVTSFFLDNVELQVCDGPPTPTPSATRTPAGDNHLRYLPLVLRTMDD